MSDSKFFVVPGIFLCKTCKQEVSSARFWFSSGEISWLCNSKHISTVALIPTKRKKRDFDE